MIGINISENDDNCGPPLIEIEVEPATPSTAGLSASHESDVMRDLHEDMAADTHQDVPHESNHNTITASYQNMATDMHHNESVHEEVTTESHQSATHDSHHTSHHNVTPWRGDRKEEANSQDLEGSFSLKANTGISDFTFKVGFKYICTIKQDE